MFVRRWFAAIFTAGQGNNNNLDFKLKEVLLYIWQSLLLCRLLQKKKAVKSEHLFLTIFRSRNNRLARNTTWKFGNGAFHRKLYKQPPYKAQILCVKDVPHTLYNAIGIQYRLLAGWPRNRGSIPGRDNRFSLLQSAQRGSWPNPAFSSVSAGSTFFWM